MDTNNFTSLGYISATIAGDSRYTDVLNVWHDPSNDTVVVTVQSSSPNGGMDGPGGSTMSMKETEVSKPGAKAPEVMKMIKKYLGNETYNFKVYGKPTKNFSWRYGDRGFNAKLCTETLDSVRRTEI